MYHYIDCGLRNVWLANGYHEIETEYGKAVSIIDVEGLHRAIGERIAKHNPKLTGAEFRFLRKELGLSQTSFGKNFGYEGQTVALWEKQSRIPVLADRMLRLMYLESMIDENSKISALIERLNEADRREADKQVFQETRKGWVSKAA